MQDNAPFRSPSIIIGTTFFALLTWFAYDPLGMYLVAGPSAVIGVWGLWALLFAHQGSVNRAGERSDKRSDMQKMMHDKDL